jgi:hypothetical protein
MYIGLQVRYLLLLQYFNKNPYSRSSAVPCKQRDPRKERQTDRHMTKLIVAFRNSAKLSEAVYILPLHLQFCICLTHGRLIRSGALSVRDVITKFPTSGPPHHYV